MISFSTALSALKAHEVAVDIVGNNLANLNTAGFKSSSTQFHDMMSQSMGSASEVGFGVSSPESVRDFSQGSIQPSQSPLDAAIEGQGFFVSQDAGGKLLYSRMGSFKLRADGALMTQTGSQALGWTAVNGVVDTSVPASPLTLTIGAQSAPIPTSNMSVSLNLDSRGVAGAATGSFKVPVEVVDSLGNKHVLTMAFTKDPVTPNTWNYAASLPASDLATGGAVTLAGSGKLTFGPDGKLVLGTPPVTSDTITINGLSDSASKMTIKWSFVDSSGAGVLTQFATDSNVSAADQDGFEAAQLVSVKIGDQGKLLAEYSNGVEQVAGQLAIASIRNPDTLASAGGSAYTTTAATAGPTIGVAGTGGRGNVLGSSIEGSNVDIAREFTNLIVYQRGYQANARVITAADELSQDTINLKR